MIIPRVQLQFYARNESYFHQNGREKEVVFSFATILTLGPSIGYKWMFAGGVTSDPYCPPCFLNQMLLLCTMATAT